MPPHPVPPPTLPAFLARCPVPPTAPVPFVAYFRALCHTVHRAHLSRDLESHSASIEPVNERLPCSSGASRALRFLFQSSYDGCHLILDVRFIVPFRSLPPPSHPLFLFPPFKLCSTPDARRPVVSRSRSAPSCHSSLHRGAWHGGGGVYRGKLSSWPRRRRMPGYCSRWSFWASLFSSDASATVASGGIDRRRRRRHRRRSRRHTADTTVQGVPCFNPRFDPARFPRRFPTSRFLCPFRFPPSTRSLPPFPAPCLSLRSSACLFPSHGTPIP